jgi:hypothetical protein
MHVETDLLHDIGNVRASECLLLGAPNKSPKVCWISNKRTRLSGNLGLCVH